VGIGSQRFGFTHQALNGVSLRIVIHCQSHIAGYISLKTQKQILIGFPVKNTEYK
jgi:hypothetical protein